jgi:hypothetical protein
MNLVYDSRDILNVAIACSVIGVAVFSCWGLYYLARILQQIFALVREARRGVSEAAATVSMLKEKVENSTAYLLVIGEALKKLVDVAKDYASGSKRTTKKKS